MTPQKLIKLFSFLFITSILLTTAFCKEKGGASDAGAGDATATAGAAADDPGRAVFMNVCASCHGAEGAGDGPAGAALKPPPRNFKTEKFKQGGDLASVTKTIENGVKGSAGMAAYKNVLKPEEIEAVAKFVVTLTGK